MKKILLIVLLLITFGCKTKQIVTDLKTNIKTDSIVKVDSSVVNKTKLEKTIKIEDNSVIQISDSFNLNIIKYDYIDGDTSKVNSKTIINSKGKSTKTEKNNVLKELKIDSESKTKIDLNKENKKKTIDKSKTTTEELPWYANILKPIGVFLGVSIILFLIWFFIIKPKL